jgi:hypothetical protein
MRRFKANVKGSYSMSILVEVSAVWETPIMGAHSPGPSNMPSQTERK